MADISAPAAESFSISNASFNNLGNETWAIERDDDGFGDISLSNEDIANDSETLSIEEARGDFGHTSFNPMSLNDEDAFGENAFSGLNLSEDNSFDELNTSEENGFDDVVSDIWGDETSLQNGEDNLEELPSEVFNESEMARLFPNN